MNTQLEKTKEVQSRFDDLIKANEKLLNRTIKSCNRIKYFYIPISILCIIINLCMVITYGGLLNNLATFLCICVLYYHFYTLLIAYPKMQKNISNQIIEQIHIHWNLTKVIESETIDKSQ
jgi:hypothetical protein